MLRKLWRCEESIWQICPVAGVMFLWGCGLFSKEADTVQLETLSFEARGDVNSNAAISLDLAVAYTSELYGELKKMTAEQYYTRVEQLRRDHYANLRIWHFEVVPDQTAGYQLFGGCTCGAVGAVLYADYKTPAEHRADVGKFLHAHVFLEKERFRLTTVKSRNVPLEYAAPVSLESHLVQHPKAISATSRSSHSL